ncbi:MAG: SCP2 sterol-binding domain-containing protein [Oleiphilaceae bacterium]|nr:SCP2 sterol-binding domain-containing protein [Oleiphilaceae bacterium]
MLTGPTLRAALTGVIEMALNRALALDPHGRKTLLAALGDIIQFRINGPGRHCLTLQRSGERVRVGSESVDEPMLELAGPPLAFAALALGDKTVFSDGRITIDGDTALAHQFQSALAQLNPDWEAALAEVTGDLPAHFMGQRVRGAVNWSRQASNSLSANLEEYIHEESRQLPGRRELEATFTDIDNLHLQAERLAARIDRLKRLASEADGNTGSSGPESS